MAKQRAVWGSKLDFILSSLGYAVGLGNIWRFPFYCGRNGGAAFLIAYLVMMVFAGLPIYYLEMSISQYSGQPPHRLWARLCPILGGLGYCSLMVCAYLSYYYNMVVAWALYYFGASFYKTLPYASCTNSWNNLTSCYDTTLAQKCQKDNLIYYNGLCQNITDQQEIDQITAQYSVQNDTPSDQYWNLEVLKISSGISDTGIPVWQLVLCLLAAWILVSVFVIKGIKSVGKSVYVTISFPYIIIIILIVRGCTLVGASEGIRFYLIPDFTKLAHSGVWLDAAVQIFYSIGIGQGGLITLSSYNKFNNNTFRDTLIVVLGNCITSFVAGFAIFPVLGHLAYQRGVDVGSLAAQGPGLTFVAYPEATSQIALPQLWGVLFFLMLVMLGVNSQQVQVEVLLTAIVDTWPSLRRSRRRMILTISMCSFFFLLGLTLTTNSGAYVLNLVDKYGAGWPIVIIGLCETICTFYIYGIKRFLGNMKDMLGAPQSCCLKFCGYPVNFIWVTNWMIIAPALLIFVLIFSFIRYEPLKLGDYVYPDYAQTVGWLLSLSVLFPLLIVALYRTQIYVMAFMRGEEPQSLFHPTDEWGPNIAEDDVVESEENTSEITDFSELAKPIDDKSMNVKDPIYTVHI